MIHIIEAFRGNRRMPDGNVVPVFATGCRKDFVYAGTDPLKKGGFIALREHPQNPAQDDQQCPTCFGTAENEVGGDHVLTDEDGVASTLDNDEILTDATEDLERDGATLKEDDGRDISDRDGQVLAEDNGDGDGTVLKEEKEEFPPTQGMGGWI